MAYRSTFVKSVQQVVITMTAQATNTAAITAVDTANSILIYDGWNYNTAGPDPSDSAVYVQLTNSTTVTGTSNAVATNTARATVVEFYPGILKAVRRGTITITGGTNSGTATFAAVNTAKAWVAYCGHVQIDTTDQAQPKLLLTNSTTATAEANATASNVVVSFEVPEFF